jgi:hypothetical protein
MNSSIGTIRRFKTKRFTVVVDALPEDSPVDVDDDGETAAAVERGDYVHFIARARVFCDGNEVATDYLGGCIYANLEDFEDHKERGRANKELRARGEAGVCGSYFADMVHEVCAQARAYLASVPTMRV